MARTKDISLPQSSCFADVYDVYVDYGKGQPVKMNDREATFIDVEKFLTGRSDQSKRNSKKKSNRVKISNVDYKNESIINNSSTHDSTANTEQSSLHQYDQDNPISHTTFTPNRHSSSIQLKPRVIYDETWSSNKQYNTRVAAFIDQIYEKFENENEQISNEYKPPRACTYEVSTGDPTDERTPPTITRRKLCLHMAVNGASKFMQRDMPLSNTDLNNGDFGDDAGMFIENRDCCFIGLADGAGGNRSFGINPADFSRAILSACRKVVHQTNLQSNHLPQLISSAIKKVEANEIQGSSTLCVLAIDKQNHTLTSLNIGDSGFIVYRDNEIYYRSKCTMNSNGSGPKQIFALRDALGLSCFTDENEILHDCSVDTVKVQKNDIIILSSDGLWDVIEGDQLQRIVERNANHQLQNLADDLLRQATDGYLVNNRDDILIIVCRVDE